MKIVLSLLLLCCTAWALAQTANPGLVMVLHGGAGTISPVTLNPEREAAARQTLEQALNRGMEVLKAGGKAVDAVQAAIMLLEDSGVFNTGKGAVANADGQCLLDASLMDGTSGKAGAVGAVSTLKNPILAARLVMDSSKHVLLVGQGAEQFGAAHGVATVARAYFLHNDNRKGLLALPPTEPHYGTVGALALDAKGGLAAGTSTGGTAQKLPGRLGDTPIIGAGTYAEAQVCAVSCTGIGEYFIRGVVAYDVAARIKYLHQPLAEAAAATLHQLTLQKGEGGFIALDAAGNVAMPFNTSGMFRAVLRLGHKPEVSIYP